MNNQDIRWRQRFDNYQNALEALTEAVELYRQRPLSKLEKQGLIKAFEFTHELAWNVIKDYFEYQGKTSIMGSRDATREAFNRGMITDGENWMEMIRSRNLTSHTYNQETADEIVEDTVNIFHNLFLQLESKLTELANVE
ncbi:MAG: nucleotidyltransferase substrate binding protein [Candidatus Methylumidiphilus sp.]